MFQDGNIDFIQDFHFEHAYTRARLKIAAGLPALFPKERSGAHILGQRIVGSREEALA